MTRRLSGKISFVGAAYGREWSGENRGEGAAPTEDISLTGAGLLNWGQLK